MCANRATADYNDAGRKDTRHAAHQNAHATIGLLQSPSAHLRGKLACNLGHRGQQRQTALGRRHGFISDAGRAAFHQVFGLLGVGGKVQVSEQHLTFAQHLAFDGLRFLDLYDQIGGVKYLCGGVRDDRANVRVFFVCEPRAIASTGFHDHLVTVLDGFRCGVGCQADAIFLRFDFFWAPDFHGVLPFVLLHLG